MSSKKLFHKVKSKLLATLVIGDRHPCAFCQRDEDDEITYGKLYAIGDIQIHYFCALLSCCLIQKGRDTEGLFGFLYPDIVAELERSKKHKCSYCHLGGASLGCSMAQCRKQFHLPCGREKNAMSLFYGNYKSFCQQHAPKQEIPEHIMATARLRMKKDKQAFKDPSRSGSTQPWSDTSGSGGSPAAGVETVCVICYEPVRGFPSPETFWPPCCASDAWFHRSCLQRMALSAGVHYLKCPLCNAKEPFYWAAVRQGVFVPDRDAAWELEPAAYADMLAPAPGCAAERCLCPSGRQRDDEQGEWSVVACLLCGGGARHAGCGAARGRYACAACRACAPADLHALAARIDAVIQQEEKQREARELRPVMPCRMSLRRTKARGAAADKPSTSKLNNIEANNSISEQKDNRSTSSTTVARLDLNLWCPRKPQHTQERTTPRTREHTVLQTMENKMFSPTKLVEAALSERIQRYGVENVSLLAVITKVKERLTKPRPLSVKKKIVNSVLDQILIDLVNKMDKSDKDALLDAQKNAEDDKVTKAYDNTHSESLKGSDESSNSTFELPSEFIADHRSDESLELFEAPLTKLTTIDIQKDSSLEISEKNEMVNIDVVKMGDNCDSKEFMKGIKLKIPVQAETCAFKFNPTDEEKIVKNNLDIDVESFKSYYLNEVDREIDREVKSLFNHKLTYKDSKRTKLRSATDFAEGASESKGKEIRKKLKRKLQVEDGVAKKKAKKNKEFVLKYKENESSNIKVVCSNDNSTESVDLTVNKPQTEKRQRRIKNNKRRKDNISSTIDVTVETPRRKNKKQKAKNKKRHRDNIRVKIRFREKHLRLKITKSESNITKSGSKIKDRKLKKLNHCKKMKQCILQYAENCTPNKVIVKPNHDVTPKKRNYFRLEKSPDAMVQTSIQSFFKKVPIPTKIL